MQRFVSWIFSLGIKNHFSKEENLRKRIRGLARRLLRLHVKSMTCTVQNKLVQYQQRTASLYKLSWVLQSQELGQWHVFWDHDAKGIRILSINISQSPCWCLDTLPVQTQGTGDNSFSWKYISKLTETFPGLGGEGWIEGITTSINSPADQASVDLSYVSHIWFHRKLEFWNSVILTLL